MKDYNGFSGAQRDKAQRWLNKQWASGTLERPRVCVACGQDKGVLDAHAEDYSEPFSAGKTDGFHICFTCHMMVHCRARSSGPWRQYRHFVETGGRAKPFFTRDFPTFSARFLNGKMTAGLFDWFDPPQRLALHEIELSQDQIGKSGPHPLDFPVRAQQ